MVIKRAAGALVCTSVRLLGLSSYRLQFSGGPESAGDRCALTARQYRPLHALPPQTSLSRLSKHPENVELPAIIG